MKNLSFITFLAVALAHAGVSAGCVTGNFVLDVKGSCSYEALLKSFTAWYAQPGNIAKGCSIPAEQELTSLLKTTTGNASAVVTSLCAGAFSRYTKVPFATSTGSNDRFVEEYFKGNGDWNEQVATLFPTYDGVLAAGEPIESMLLKRDARTVDTFYDEEARRSIVAVPNLPNFDKCSMNAAYCCWPKDRQAQDNNGDCNQPYDSRCVDSDPADNTDLCFVNHAEGAKSTGSKASSGWLNFPFDDGSNQFSAEGPIHCHGFAWADDATDPSAVYRGNNLFFVSLYDHMYTRGYVKNIPAAPMCACAEQMPTVSRADCTQIDFENGEHNFKFTFRNGAFSARLVSVFIKFNACKGIDEDGVAKNNDLWSYMNRLYLDDKVSGEKLQALTQKLVGNENCHIAEARNLNMNNLTRGFKQFDDKWIILRGKDALFDNRYYGKEAFNYLVDSKSNTPAILMRACASCYFDQQWLWYKRLTPIPSDFDLWNQLQFYGQDSSTGTVGNLYGVDFNIYGSYQDALDNKNAWKCNGYSYSDGFPGNCDPNGNKRSSQGAFFDSSWTKPDVAWFVENKGRVLNALPQTESRSSGSQMFGSFYDMVAINIGSHKIPGQAYVEGSGNTMYLSASGADISGKSDSLKFAYRRASGDVTMVVRVNTMDTKEQYGKAGLMIRESLAPGSKTFGVFIHGKLSVVNLYRAATDDWMQYRGELPGSSTRVWLKLTKRMNVFTAYRSADGVSWAIVGTPQTFSMNSTDLKIGVGLTSAGNWRQIEATFDNFDTSNYYFPSAAPSQSEAPSRDITYTPARDIGRYYDRRYPSDVGLQKSKYIIMGAGYDIWNSEDSFSFVNFTVTGDFDMTAKVTSIVAKNAWTKFGLMARDSLDPKSKQICPLFAPNQGSMIQLRNTYGGSTSNFYQTYDKPKSIWLRLKREGNVFNSYRSLVGTKLGECVWQLMGSFDASNIAFNSTGTMQIGMAVTSHNTTEYAIAEYDQFNIATPSSSAGGATSQTGTKRALRGVEDNSE